MTVRPPALAGTWYPSKPRHLSRSIEELLASVDVPVINGEILGAIIPHAGHVYSGLVAAHAFRILMEREPDVVVIVSPMHQPYLGEVFSTSHQAYQTPLGDIPVATNLVNSFKSKLSHQEINLQLISNDAEHAIEIELPFLQHIYPTGFELLPIMIRHASPKIEKILGETLVELLGEHDTVYISSSDLSHFYDQDTARKLDDSMIKAVLTLDPKRILTVEKSGEGFACGVSAIRTILWATLKAGANQIKLLNYATSGDVSGDYTNVVGYASLSISREQDKG